MILAVHTDWPIDYELTPFRLTKIMSQDSIELLKEIIKDGYNVYVFKTPTYINEKNSLEKLIIEHGFILKNHSDTFYKLKINDE